MDSENNFGECPYVQTVNWKSENCSINPEYITLVWNMKPLALRNHKWRNTKSIKGNPRPCKSMWRLLLRASRLKFTYICTSIQHIYFLIARTVGHHSMPQEIKIKFGSFLVLLSYLSGTMQGVTYFFSGACTCTANSVSKSWVIFYFF